MFFLSANNGPQAGMKYDLTKDKCVLGRHPDCDIVVEVGAVSRQHAQVLKDGSSYFVEDLGSRNGTFLNEEPGKIEGRRALKPGDQIRVCEVTFTFQTSAAQTPLPGAFGASPTSAVESAGLGAVLVDDESQGASSTIMSRLDVSSSSRGLNVSASPEIKLAALIEITQNLGKALQLDDVLPNILKSLFKIFVQADRGFVVLRSDDGKLIPRWTRVRREDQGDTIRISRTIVRHVMETKQAILSADAANDKLFEMSQSIADFRIRSMMCAPLLDTEGNALGVLQVDTLDQRKRFQKEDLELLVSTASQASIAIQNAQMHETAIKQKELERDMKLAHEVQRGFLPDRRPELPGYQFFDYYQSTDLVGGDYFDYISLPDGRVAVVVADVVGHGIAAALLMAKVSAETRNSLYGEARPAAAMTRLNEKLCQLGLNRFVTMIMVVLDPATNKAVIVNAGHMAPLHRRKNGLEEPGSDIAGLPLGITDAMGYEQFETQVEPGDLLTLYTDGINECMDAGGEFYTIERMRDFILKGSRQPQQIGPSLIESVRHFLGKAPQNDDMCLVCLGRA
jgi:serine phosphatase RsbU (regulator of sigma subunit)